MGWAVGLIHPAEINKWSVISYIISFFFVKQNSDLIFDARISAWGFAKKSQATSNYSFQFSHRLQVSHKTLLQRTQKQKTIQIPLKFRTIAGFFIRKFIEYRLNSNISTPLKGLWFTVKNLWCYMPQGLVGAGYGCHVNQNQNHYHFLLALLHVSCFFLYKAALGLAQPLPLLANLTSRFISFRVFTLFSLNSLFLKFGPCLHLCRLCEISSI